MNMQELLSKIYEIPVIPESLLTYDDEDYGIIVNKMFYPVTMIETEGQLANVVSEEKHSEFENSLLNRIAKKVAALIPKDGYIVLVDFPFVKKLRKDMPAIIDGVRTEIPVIHYSASAGIIVFDEEDKEDFEELIRQSNFDKKMFDCIKQIQEHLDGSYVEPELHVKEAEPGQNIKELDR